LLALRAHHWQGIRAMSRARCVLLLGLLNLLPSSGCESKATVTGTVLVDGKKLAKGYITFYPVTDRGELTGAKAETKGAEISEGAYTVENLSPGKRKAIISVPPDLTVRKAADGSEAAVKATLPATPIAPKAPGNSKVVDIKAGSQTVDFELKLK
jgi:hypothetical protein